MPRPIRPLLALALLSGCIAIAPAFQSKAQYTPDPALRSESRADLEARVRRACQATQAKLTGAPEAALEPNCACYASRTIRSFDRLEMQNYRTRGMFDDTGRLKALKAIDQCGLKRPA